MQMSLFQMFGQEDSPARTSHLRGWGRELGLKGKNLDSFLNLLDYLKKDVPEFSSSRTFQVSSLATEEETSTPSLRTLAGLGYGVGWRVLNSRYFGVPQSRQRVYIVGCHRDWRGPGQILFESECGQRDTAPSGSNGTKPVSPFKERIGDPRKGPITPSLAYCLYACSARHTGTDWSRNYVSYPDGRVRRLLPIECESDSKDSRKDGPSPRSSTSTTQTKSTPSDTTHLATQ